MKTLEELKAVREKMESEVALRTHDSASSKYEKHVLVCGGCGGQRLSCFDYSA